MHTTIKNITGKIETLCSQLVEVPKPGKIKTSSPAPKGLSGHKTASLGRVVSGQGSLMEKAFCTVATHLASKDELSGWTGEDGSSQLPNYVEFY